ncbi:UPF0678 fatty acid-binding protein-like protein [Hordeum vulgare]|nr:UPF0678 fatty acid-binding protein-like protein [Hordeum vulgare]
MSFLLGKWREEGEGTFPTIASFFYGEETLFFHHLSKPVISCTQRTWKAASGDAMHAESGYWRPRPDGSIEVVIAQSTCLTEVQKTWFIKWPKVMRMQRQCRIFKQRLKVPPALHQFTRTLDKNLMKDMNKYDVHDNARSFTKKLEVNKCFSVVLILNSTPQQTMSYADIVNFLIAWPSAFIREKDN